MASLGSIAVTCLLVSASGKAFRPPPAPTSSQVTLRVTEGTELIEHVVTITARIGDEMLDHGTIIVRFLPLSEALGLFMLCLDERLPFGAKRHRVWTKE